jgi:Mce-associated membrane protein
VGSGGASAGSAASAGTEPAEAVPPQRPADAPEEQAPEEQAPEVARAPAARRRGPSWALFAAVCALAVVALAAAVLLWLSHPSDADLRKSALLAARSYTTSLTTFDARTLDQDVARVKKVSSPDFAKQYDATIAGVRAQITKSQTISAGAVVGAGIESTGKDTATVLVAVNQKIAVTGQAARTEANRVRMVLVRRSGNWYVQSVQRL